MGRLGRPVRRPAQPAGPAAVGGGAVRARAGPAAARAEGTPRRRARGDPRHAARGADERLPADLQIAERSGGAWKPSPGSVYPTIQQLEDEGLVEADDERGRRTLRLTDEGRTYVEEHADELAETWAPFGRQFGERRGDEVPPGGEYAALKPEIGQVMAAVWQIVTTGTDRQRREAINILIETRRKLYGLLADGDDETRPVRPTSRHGEEDDDYPGADGGER